LKNTLGFDFYCILDKFRRLNILICSILEEFFTELRSVSVGFILSLDGIFSK